MKSLHGETCHVLLTYIMKILTLIWNCKIKIKNKKKINQIRLLFHNLIQINSVMWTTFPIQNKPPFIFLLKLCFNWINRLKIMPNFSSVTEETNRSLILNTEIVCKTLADLLRQFGLTMGANIIKKLISV